jgi:hypothetical protein
MQSNVKKFTTHYLGGIRYDIADETVFHPKVNPGRIGSEQAELEAGVREQEQMQQWCEREAELQQLHHAKNF